MKITRLKNILENSERKIADLKMQADQAKLEYVQERVKDGYKYTHPAHGEVCVVAKRAFDCSAYDSRDGFQVQVRVYPITKQNTIAKIGERWARIEDLTPTGEKARAHFDELVEELRDLHRRDEVVMFLTTIAEWYDLKNYVEAIESTDWRLEDIFLLQRIRHGMSERIQGINKKQWEVLHDKFDF